MVLLTIRQMKINAPIFPQGITVQKHLGVNSSTKHELESRDLSRHSDMGQEKELPTRALCRQDACGLKVQAGN